MIIALKASKEAKSESRRRAILLSCPFDQYRSKSCLGQRRQAPIPVPIPRVPEANKNEVNYTWRKYFIYKLPLNKYCRSPRIFSRIVLLLLRIQSIMWQVECQINFSAQIVFSIFDWVYHSKYLFLTRIVQDIETTSNTDRIKHKYMVAASCYLCFNSWSVFGWPSLFFTSILY